MVNILQFSFSLSYTGPKILLYTFLSKMFNCFLCLFVSVQVSDAHVNILSSSMHFNFLIFFFKFLLTMHLSIILVTDQLNAPIIVSWWVYYTPLHVSSTIVPIIRRSKLYHTASGIITVCRWPSNASDGRLQSVIMPDAVWYNFDILMMGTIVLETCRGV